MRNCVFMAGRRADVRSLLKEKTREAGVSKDSVPKLAKLVQTGLCRILTVRFTHISFLCCAFSRLNAQGHLVCQVCSDVVKSEVLWNTHLQGKKHKQVREQCSCGISFHCSHFMSFRVVLLSGCCNSEGSRCSEAARYSTFSCFSCSCSCF